MKHSQRRSTAYAATKRSILALRPAAPQREPGEPERWEVWDKWAEWAGLLTRNGAPSLSKVKLLIRHHCLAATVRRRCGVRATFHRINTNLGPNFGKPIYRFQKRIIVAPRSSDQLSWGPEDWQSEHARLFSRCQSRKAQKSRK